MINEGGSVELDGRGTLLACKSSILNKNRNPNLTQEQAERIFAKYLGATNFIWLNGQSGLDITDQHIDGFARFVGSNTIVTMEWEDLLYYDVVESDIQTLFNAKDVDGRPYNFVKLPLTKNSVFSSSNQDLGRASYCNFYIANTKVLVPIYNDPNDKKALAIIQSLFPKREVVGIDATQLYEFGGMIHCITQQQPAESGL